MTTNERFCVWQFFEDGSREKVRDWVSLEDSVSSFRHYTTSVAAKLGITQRVIIVDSGNCICAEWIYKKGVVFPVKES